MAENDPDDLTGLPLQPTPEQLPEAYRLCRKKLAQANWSRSALKGHDDYRGSLISELRADLERLEVGFHKEAHERAAVHALNERVMEIIQSLEGPLDEAASIVQEKDKGHEQAEAPPAQPRRNQSGNDAPDRVGGGSLFGVGSGAVFDVG